MHLAEFDFPIVLFLFVAISAVNWFVEKFKNQHTSSPPQKSSGNLEDLYESFREEILQRQTNLSPRPQAPPDLPITEDIGSTLTVDPAADLLTPPPTDAYTVHDTQLSQEEKEALINFERRSKAKSHHPRKTTTNLKRLLRSPNSARQAIILHEVLGKPKSLQQNT